MSDWEDLCDRMGWPNDEAAAYKLIDYIEGKGTGRVPSHSNHKFTSPEECDYAIKKSEERRILSTPIGQYLLKRWKKLGLSNIQQRVWDESGSSCKSIYVEIGNGYFDMTITKYDESSYCVEFCNMTGESVPALCTKASGKRLTPALIEQAIVENSVAVSYQNRNHYHK